MNLQSLSDSHLLSSTQSLVREECALATKVLHHLREIERRKLYSAKGFPSLFEYAVDQLGYSESEAYRRISAMKIIGEMPEIESKLATGKISLTNIALAQTVFRRELRVHGKTISKEQKLDLLHRLEGKTTRQAEKVVMEVTSSPVSLMSDRIRPIGDEAVEIRFAGDQALIQKIAQLRGLLAHKEPNITLGELFEKLCDLGIQTWSPQFAAPRKHRVAAQSETSENKEITAALPAEVRRQIWRRDQGRCKKCGSIYKLEIDHIHPRAIGGTNDLNNLRLLCRPCNHRMAIETYGITKIEGVIKLNSSVKTNTS